MMKITNNYNLPAPIFNAVNKIYPPAPGRLSVTRLIDSPLVAKLLAEHWDDLEEDASDRLWPLLGQAMDYVLTQYAPKDWIVQEKIEVPIDGITIVGKVDILEPSGRLGDWKATSVWSYIFGGRAEWEKQLNSYDWLERQKGRNVTNLVAHRLFRDWTTKKTGDNDYPPIPFISLEIPRWSPEEQDEYIKQQIEYHTQCKDLHCTPEEKWEKPTTYAVMKKGRKSALRVLDDYRHAEEWCANNAHGAWLRSATVDIDGSERQDISIDMNISIIKRPGECTRCKSYCPVRSVCPDNKEKNNLKEVKYGSG